jgi:hypothetical protein
VTNAAECLACSFRSDRLPCDEHLPEVMREIEARGYARGVIADRDKLIASAELRGYARGVEDAAKVLGDFIVESSQETTEYRAGAVHCAHTVRRHIRALLKPKGEAK